MSKRRIGILIFDGAEELDWAGPWEVLAAWSKQWPEDGVEVFTLAHHSDGPITCAKGLRVLPDHSPDSAPPMQLVIVPGGRGARALVTHEPTLAWLRTLRQDGVLVTSVCTGALMLAAAGLLRQRPAATWWGAFDELLAIDPTIEPRRDDRFVDDGDVVTAAGVSAGIDMALHLVVRLHSVERARDVRRYIQYDPEPPVRPDRCVQPRPIRPSGAETTDTPGPMPMRRTVRCRQSTESSALPIPADRVRPSGSQGPAGPSTVGSECA